MDYVIKAFYICTAVYILCFGIKVEFRHGHAYVNGLFHKFEKTDG